MQIVDYKCNYKINLFSFIDYNIFSKNVVRFNAIFLI